MYVPILVGKTRNFEQWYCKHKYLSEELGMRMKKYDVEALFYPWKLKL